jgi:hypothetical protein
MVVRDADMIEKHVYDRNSVRQLLGLTVCAVNLAGSFECSESHSSSRSDFLMATCMTYQSSSGLGAAVR